MGLAANLASVSKTNEVGNPSRVRSAVVNGKHTDHSPIVDKQRNRIHGANAVVKEHFQNGPGEDRAERDVGDGHQTALFPCSAAARASIIDDLKRPQGVLPPSSRSRPFQKFQETVSTKCYLECGFPHRESAASLALSTRFLGESFLALAFPPFNPPNRPKIAAGEEFIF